MATPLSPRRAVLAALAAILVHVSGAMAQVTVEVAPYAGLYVPLGSMLRPSPPSKLFYSPYGPPVTSVAQRTALAFGGHITAWLAPRLGFEGTLSYAPSGVNMAGRNDGHVITGSATLVAVPLTFFGFLRAFHVGGGVGIVDHGGAAYEGIAGATRVAPTVAAGIAANVGASKVLRIDVEDYLFRPHLSFGSGCIHVDSVCNALDQPAMPGFQHDLILSMGLAFRTR